MIRVALIVVAIALSGCAGNHPLIVAEAGGHQIARKDEDRKVRAAAALKEEPDLLTYSVDAIVRGKNGRSRSHIHERLFCPRLQPKYEIAGAVSGGVVVYEPLQRSAR